MNPPKGGYKNLIVYWLATTIYDLTVKFCDTYMSYPTYKSYTRTIDQMIQAARSGKQNIVEGSLEKSVESNLKLTGVARASYGELLEDFIDFLRQHNLSLWNKDDPRVLAIRRTPDSPYKSYKSYKSYMSYTREPEGFANLLITLCYKQSFLLDRLLAAQEEKFVKEGGFREQLFQKRLRYRSMISTLVFICLIGLISLIRPIRAVSPSPALYISPFVQPADRASDSSYSLQVKNIEIVERPRLEHLKFFVLGKFKNYQYLLLSLLLVVSFLIILRKTKKK